MLFTSSLLVDLVSVVLLALWLLHKYISRKYDYWKIRGVPFFQPKPFFGNARDVFLMKSTIGDWIKDFHDSFETPYVGFFVFDEPYLMINSPELIKHVLVKDFNYFTDRTVATPEHNEIMQHFMFLQKNPRWKDSRAKITQVFSTGRMKGMFPIMKTIGEEFISHLRQKAGILDAKRVLMKYSTEITARCFFGIRANSFDDDDAAFNVISREMFAPSPRNGVIQILYFYKQAFVHLFHLEFVAKWIQNYLEDMFWTVMKQREKTGEKVNDLIDILKDLMETDEVFAKDNKKIVAHVFQFYVGGYETTSTTISFALYELAVNPRIQQKLREEITRIVEKHKALTYDSIKELTYLDMCICETLRKHPVLTFLDRRCNADYKLPGTDLVIEKGLPVYIPLHALHLSEKYFPEPDMFIPERFSDKSQYNKNGLFYMPFGSGPRICIGERFGLLSSKLALSMILLNFEISVCPQTPIPIEYDPKCFLITPKGGLPVTFTRLTDAT